MGRLLGVGLLLLLVWSGASGQALERFQSDHFQMSYPSSWEEHQGEGGNFFFLYAGRDIINPGLENFSVHLTQISENMSFDMFCYMGRHQVESSYPEMKMLRSREFMVGKLTGQRFDYGGKIERREMQILQVLLMHGDLGYTLFFVATPANYKSLSPAAEAAIRSLKPR